MVANCRVKMTRSFCPMPPKPGILSEIWIGFFLILTFESAIARRRCWTAASSAASISPFFTSPDLVLPSQTQTGSLAARPPWVRIFAAAAGAVAICLSSYRRLDRPVDARFRSARRSCCAALRRPSCAPSPSSSVIMPALDQRRERLVQRLHAELRLADLHLRVDLVDLVLADQVPDGGVRAP